MCFYLFLFITFNEASLVRQFHFILSIRRRRRSTADVDASFWDKLSFNSINLHHIARVLKCEAEKNMLLLFLKCSKEDVSVKLGKAIESVPAVHISNPKTLDFQVTIIIF